MLSVTVMMFRDIVESVMLLKEEARSVCRRRCFRRRRLCFRMSREEVLCSVELLSLGGHEGQGPGHRLQG